jgi:hypothetical protein
MTDIRVDLLHLLEDLRDAYPGALEETILTEIFSSALDSGATLIRIHTDSAGASVTITGYGSGCCARSCASTTTLPPAARRAGRASVSRARA